MNVLKFSILLSAFFYSCECYKFLFIYPLPTGSHYNLASRLFKELAKRGHEVTLFTPFEEKQPIQNLNVIPLEGLRRIWAGREKTFFDLEDTTPLQKARAMIPLSFKLTHHVLECEQFQKLLKSNEQFDAVFIYQYLNDAFMGVAHHFKAPAILLSSMPLYSPESFTLSHPSNPAYVPNILTEYTGRMTFWQRLRNTFYDTSIILYYLWNYLPKHRELVREFIPGQPDLYDFLNNASLLLINSHVSATEAIPQVPNAIEIGGYHIEDPKPLPQDLQKFLDESKNGVILFSMGTIAKSVEFPESKRNELIKAFAKMKENVLWKWENDDLPGLSKNVKIMKWIPQSDVLAHPNVKLFISHGGLLSTLESIYHAVPIVGIPVMVDQKMNMEYATSYEYAVTVSYKELEADKIVDAVELVKRDPKYRNNIKKRSSIIRDRPIKPIDEALYWIEYVIRHQGAPHLRYPGMDLSWAQRNLLDIVAFVLVVVLTTIFVLVKAFKLVFKKKKSIVTKQKKRN